MHSLLIYTSIWIYLVTNYGDERILDTIPMYVALALYFITLKKNRLAH